MHQYFEKAQDFDIFNSQDNESFIEDDNILNQQDNLIFEKTEDSGDDA